MREEKRKWLEKEKVGRRERKSVGGKI